MAIHYGALSRWAAIDPSDSCGVGPKSMFVGVLTAGRDMAQAAVVSPDGRAVLIAGNFRSWFFGRDGVLARVSRDPCASCLAQKLYQEDYCSMQCNGNKFF